MFSLRGKTFLFACFIRFFECDIFCLGTANQMEMSSKIVGSKNDDAAHGILAHNCGCMRLNRRARCSIATMPDLIMLLEEAFRIHKTVIVRNVVDDRVDQHGR
jgi:hypothetical protein